MRQDPASDTFKTYNIKAQTFKHFKPEDFLQMMKDFKTATDRTKTTSSTGKIQFLHTILCGEYLR